MKLKETDNDTLNLLKVKLFYMYEIGRISMYQCGQLVRYFEELLSGKKPFLNINKKDSHVLKVVVQRLKKEVGIEK